MEGWYHNSSVMVQLQSVLGTGSIITYLQVSVPVGTEKFKIAHRGQNFVFK